MPILESRRPQQERGQRRVDAILDAAATLVTEVGVAGVTVGAIAERARTSKGSLYHFFPDRESVLHALAERHVAALRAMLAAIRDDASIDWRALAPEDVVGRMLDPFKTYTAEHPDLPLILRAPADNDATTSPRADVLAALIDLAAIILRARHPGMRAPLVALRAAAVVAVIDGMSGAARRLDGRASEAMTAEMRRVLGAYLRTF
ncbi:MAG: TetR/AcrR family transcriptional regulator [Gemmatirosa sp.]|nr:TetR/AcrR family transcriptional regulator [Gemmatirosa sp.]